MFHLIITGVIYVFLQTSIDSVSASNVSVNHQIVLSNYTKYEENAFLFLYPRTFLAGKNETVCAVFQSKYFPARIKIDMKIKNKHAIFNEVLQSETDCFNLSIPIHKSLEVLSADLIIYLECGDRVLHEKSYESILIYPNTDVIFMETDRQIYRPGDNVKIRIIQLNQDMIPTFSNSTALDIKIINPQGFIVHAENNLIPRLGIVHYDYQLANSTTLGTWNIECNNYRKTFLVKNYIVPRFKVSIYAPKGLFIQAELLSFKVCAKYTFGKGLRGHSFAKITYSHDSTFSHSKLLALNSDGCSQFTFNNSELSLSKPHPKHQTVNIFVTVTEDGTSQMETETIHVNLHQQPYELKYLTEATYYQPGLPYKNKLKITRGYLNDYSKEFAEICYQIAWKNDWNLKPVECAVFQFDKDGVVPFSILPLKENVKQVKITAKSLNHTEVIAKSLILRRWHSVSTSYLKIERNSKLFTKCKAPQQFTVFYSANKLKNNERVTFYYMMSTSNDILTLRKYYHTVNKSYVDFEYEMGNTLSPHNKYTKIENYVDKFVLKFRTHEKIYSKGHLTVFYVNRGETISNSINLYVEKCLPINVTAKWTMSSIQPGDFGNLMIKTSKPSICAISSVDTANYFLDSTKRLNVNKIIQPFIARREFKSKRPSCEFGQSQSKDVILPGTYKQMNATAGFDSFEDFNNVGVSIITNTAVISKPCKETGDLMLPYYQIITDDEYTKAEQDWNEVRTYFPATWHWDLLETDKHGIIVLRSKTPDSITTWNTNILCTSNEGIGVTNTKLVSMKSFFVAFSVPQKLNRHEILSLQISAHNYYNYSLPIQLVLNTTLEQLDEEKFKDIVEIPANEIFTKTVKLRSAIIQNAILSVQMKLAHHAKDWSGSYFESNSLDEMEKRVNVVYEGYPQVKTKTILLCGLNAAHNLTWNRDIPEDHIVGSQDISVVLYSDLVGPVMQNLEDLIVLPTGCGEQVMAVMAPNFYVMQYLKSINNLLPFVRKRILKNLQIGYQKILEYLHGDGSFSAFGALDSMGSMFLTTFVLRSLKAASEYIFVDPMVLNNALKWILEHQLENGCFASVSHVFQDMGGASMENSTSALTSYVIINLLESKFNISYQIRQNAMFCIRGQLNPDVYSLAINTYALYLLGDDLTADHELGMLIKSANKNDNFMWWNSTRDSRSMDIETTGYVLMSMMYRISNDNLIFANGIIRWLLNQRNAQGGFLSSQDTVVALDAITRYASTMHERNAEMNITLSDETTKHETRFKKTELARNEEFSFPKDTKKIKLTYEGTGCVLTQFLLRYNIESPKNNKAFELNINPITNTANCLISTLVPCFKYSNLNHPTMIVMEIFMPSGYDSEKNSLHNIVGIHKNLKKIEEFSNKVVFYFTDLVDETICIPFNITRTSMVTKLYNSTISLYEYYNPDRQIIKAYNLPNECILN